MYIVNENDLEYRFGDSGPKYLLKGPRVNFAIVRFNPGQDFPAHYHEIMEEDFYILEGTIDIYVEDKKYTLKEGDFISIPPQKTHYVKNNYKEPIKMVSVLGPHQVIDKVDVKDYKIPE